MTQFSALWSQIWHYLCKHFRVFKIVLRFFTACVHILHRITWLYHDRQWSVESLVRHLHFLEVELVMSIIGLGNFANNKTALLAARPRPDRVCKSSVRSHFLCKTIVTMQDQDQYCIFSSLSGMIKDYQ